MKILMSFIFFAFITPVEWLTNMDAAREQAGKESKYILLNFSGSDWCAPCIKMKQEVFESESFLAIAQKKLVLVRADFPRTKKNKLSKELTEHNEMLAEKYNNTGKFPLTLLLDAHGKIIHQWEGYTYASQEKFIEELKNTLPDN